MRWDHYWPKYDTFCESQCKWLLQFYKKRVVPKRKSSHSIISSNITVCIGCIRCFATSPQGNEKIPIRHRYYRQVFQNCKSSSNSSGPDHECGVYIPLRLGYLIRATNLHINREWQVAQRQVFRSAVHASRYKAVEHNRLPPTNHWTHWTFLQYNCNEPWPLCCRPSTWPGRICLAVSIPVKHRFTSVYHHHILQSCTVAWPFWASIIPR